MVKKLAIDWDENELRLVAAQCSGRNVKVTDAVVIPIENSSVSETLRSVIHAHGLQNTETLVAIGRGKAELRELQLPPVPDDELPDMVRFQAIRSFATAGDSATVDYLVTNRTESGVEMIAAAIGPTSLTEIRETCDAAELPTKRISLRPLAASALYLMHRPSTSEHDTVLIDLLGDDAEIVVIREGQVVFVRTVRMPSVDAARGRALGGELLRSLLACGSSGPLERVILWGRESVHAADVQMLAEASSSQVDVIDPFELVDVERKAKSDLPEHVGRLAPLVGLLAADEHDSDRLIDFLNPRQRVEETPNPYRKAILIGVPVACCLLLCYAVYSQMKGLDRQIAELKSANAAMEPDIELAMDSIEKTEAVDVFLDSDVNWLREIRRLAESMPPSDQLIVRNISGTILPRGGGTLTVEGAVANPSVIDQFEESLRDQSHVVTGDGASEEETADTYRWGFTEAITVTPASIRNDRYAGMTAPPLPPDDSPADDAPADDAPPDDAPPDDAPPDDAPPDDAPPDDAPPETDKANVDPVNTDESTDESTPDAEEESAETPAPSDQTDQAENPELAAGGQAEVQS